MGGLNATRANLAMRFMAAAITLALLAFPFGNGYAPVAAAHAPAAGDSQHAHHSSAGHAAMAAGELAPARSADCDHPVSKPIGPACEEGSCAYGLCHAMVAVPAISFDRPPLEDSPASGPATVFVMLAGEMAERPPRA